MTILRFFPLELVHEVVRQLDVESALALKQASRDFNAAVDLNVLPKSIRKAFLIKAESFPQNAKLFSCFECLRMLPGHCFGRRQRRGKLSRSRPRLDGRRFCLDCAAELHLYEHDRGIRTCGKEVVYLCHKCSRYGTRPRHCGISGSDARDFTSPEWVCWSETSTLGSPSLLGLPKVVLGLVVSQLILRANVDYQDIDLYERHRFSYIMSLRADSDMACYACFKVLPIDAFTDIQLDLSRKNPNTSWKRRCRKCLFALYANSGHEKALAEWTSRLPCLCCRFLKAGDSRCLGCFSGASIPEANIPEANMPDENQLPPTLPPTASRSSPLGTNVGVIDGSIPWISFDGEPLHLDLQSPSRASSATPGKRALQLRNTLSGLVRKLSAAIESVQKSLSRSLALPHRN
ncbi:hypothetical protein BJ170DRAFT_731962 [Xylariales sp. AK1849]|nr:hypothetical protein BJ170DRAFT_731962 [Xylariales sp. AK1849]